MLKKQREYCDSKDGGLNITSEHDDNYEENLFAIANEIVELENPNENNDVEEDGIPTFSLGQSLHVICHLKKWYLN